MAAKKSSGNFFTNAVKSAVAAVQKAFTPAPAPKPQPAPKINPIIAQYSNLNTVTKGSSPDSRLTVGAPRQPVSGPAPLRNTISTPLNVGSATQSGGLSSFSQPSSSYQAPTSNGGFDFSRALQEANNFRNSFTSSFKVPSLVKPVYADDGKSLPLGPTQFKQGVPAIQSNSFIDNLKNLATPRGAISGLGTLSKAGLFGPTGMALAGINDATSGGVGNALAYITPGAGGQPKQSFGATGSYTMGPALNLTASGKLPSYDTNKYKTQQTDTASKVKTITDEITNKANQAGIDTSEFIDQSEGLYGVLTNDIAQGSEEIAKLIESGSTTQEEGARMRAELEERKINEYFETQKKLAESMIPGYEAEFELGKKRVFDNIAQEKVLGETRKADIGNKYGEIVRGITEKKNTSGANLRNLFSSLGSAESSAAIEQFSNLENEANRQSTDSEQEKVKLQTDVDTQIANNAKSYQDTVSQLEIEKNKRITEVRNNIQIAGSDKSRQIAAINANFGQQVADLKTDTYNKQIQLKQLEQTQLMNRQNLFDTAYVNRAASRDAASDQLALLVPTLNDPEAITVRSSGKAVSRPRGVPADMWSTAKQWAETQGFSGSSLSQRLRQQFGNAQPYASWYDTIENLVV